MAEFSEIIKQFKRLCKSISPVICTRGECPMGCKNIEQCRRLAFEKPAHFAATVMRWAAENPEPQYPTWFEWLHDNGIILDARQHNEYEHWIPGLEAMKPIPADIAEKLGIAPKEGQ